MNKEIPEASKKFLTVLVAGVLDVNTYILGCPETKEAAVIDPGGREEETLDVLARQEMNLKYIINTHGHLDHSIGNHFLKERTGAEILIHAEDAILLVIPQDPMLSLLLQEYNVVPADIKVEENDIIKVGRIELKVIHTPGHTPGGMCLLFDKVIFTGDTLFAGGIGRTDLLGGSYETLIRSIEEKLMVLDNGLKVLPGHGAGTTINRERRVNPFLSECQRKI